MVSRLTFWIILLLSPQFSVLAQENFIMCKCDTPECQAANVSECKAKYQCYVAFRPTRPEERKPSSSYGLGSRHFIAEHRGCVPLEQMDICQYPDGGAGGFDNLNEHGEDAPSIVRCCQDNYCNVGQEIEFTRAELEGRQFFMNPQISDLEPGLEPIKATKSSGGPKNRVGGISNYLGGSHRRHDNAMGRDSQRKRPLPLLPSALPPPPSAYANDVPFNHQWFLGPPARQADPQDVSSASALADFGLLTPKHDAAALMDANPTSQVQQQLQPRDGGGGEDSNNLRPVIILQPLHIAIGVCLIVLMLVAVLLHIVIVLHRRHRRLKRELIKRTQKTTIGDPHQHQWPSSLNNTIVATSSGQPINLQQLKYSSSTQASSGEQDSQQPFTPKRSCFSCLGAWNRPQNKPPTTNVYGEVLPPSSNSMTPEMVQFRQDFQNRGSQNQLQQQHTPMTYHSSLHSSVATPPTLHGSPAFHQAHQAHHPQHPPPPPPQNQMQAPLQPVLYSPHSPEHNFHMNPVKNAYGTGSSVSGGSGNNVSTAESSLPTQSWSNTNTSNNNMFPHNGLPPPLPSSTQERPSLSGSSEAGGGLITPDFETRRANVAMPPTLLSGELIAPQGPSPTGLALFRSAGEVEDCGGCDLVTPYAQLRLSLTFDHYDTPEQVFVGDGGGGGSGSLDGFGASRNQASSNPTTNSSLLHSYCEHGGGGGGTGDFRV